MRNIAFALIILLSIGLYSKLSKEKPTVSIEIDHIYLLNLDRSTDRYKKMSALLDSLQLPVKYTRFSAVDGNNIELVNKQTGERIKGSEFAAYNKPLKGEFSIVCQQDWSGDFESLHLDRIGFYPRAKGEIAVACSHRKIWQDIVKQDYKNAIVFEDDLIFAPNFSQYLNQALKHVPYDYDLLFLGIIDHPNSYNQFSNSVFINKILPLLVKDPNPYFIQVWRNIAAMWGYIVSLDGAQRLLDKTAKHRYIDIVISKLIKQREINAYAIKPKQVFSDNSPSTIGDNNVADFDELERSNVKSN